MIDLHNHILPGVDDGPREMEEAVEMARMAVADGIRTIVATPHAKHPIFNVTPHDRDRVLAQLDDRLQAEGISLQLVPGAEVHAFERMLDAFESDRCFGLGNSDWILLEWPNDMALELAKSLIFDARVRGLNLLMAHAERHPDAKSGTLMDELVRAGLRLQVNAESLTRRFGGRSGRVAKRLVRDGLCYVIASDAHGADTRLPKLAEALESAKKIIGPQAEAFVVEHPKRVLYPGG